MWATAGSHQASVYLADVAHIDHLHAPADPRRDPPADQWLPTPLGHADRGVEGRADHARRVGRHHGRTAALEAPRHPVRVRLGLGVGTAAGGRRGVGRDDPGRRREQGTVTAHRHHRVQPQIHRARQDTFGRVRVDLPHQARIAVPRADHARGVQHRVGVTQQSRHDRVVAEVTGEYRNRSPRAQPIQHGRVAFVRWHQKVDRVAGLEQRQRRVGAEVAGGPGDRYAHCMLPSRVLLRYQWHRKVCSSRFRWDHSC